MKQTYLLVLLAMAAVACKGPRGDHGDLGLQGQQGITGEQGNTGQDGYSMVSQVLASPAGSCGQNPDGSNIGGSVVNFAKDVLGTGSYASCDPIESSVLICNGATGATGETGATGATGAQGQAGINATPITIVQFCPGTPQYPSVFPEIGLCLNNHIYAVYSANNGFLVILTPGLYQSNAIGSSCTFSVPATGCTISH